MASRSFAAASAKFKAQGLAVVIVAYASALAQVLAAPRSEKAETEERATGCCANW